MDGLGVEGAGVGPGPGAGPEARFGGGGMGTKEGRVGPSCDGTVIQRPFPEAATSIGRFRSEKTLLLGGG